MKKRSRIRRIASYIAHYGIVGTASLAYEKLVVDKKRFFCARHSVQEASGKWKVASEKSKANRESIPHSAQVASGKSKVNRESNSHSSQLAPSSSLFGSSLLYLVHYFYPERRGGTERFTLNLAKAAAAFGARVTVLVLDANLPKSAYPKRHGAILYREYEHDGISCIGFRHIKAPRGLYYKNITESDGELREFARFLIDTLGITLVHATYPQPFVPFLAECREMSIPYVLTCTDFAMICHYATMVDKCGAFCGSSEGAKRCARVCKTVMCPDFSARREAARKALFGALAVTAPSDFVKQVLTREFEGLNVITVNHGIADDFKPERRRDKVRTFLYAGTLSPLKGIHLLIDAFSRLEGDLRLIVAGSGDEKYISSLRRAADGRVSFIGAVDADKMPSLYSEADCVVVPSMWYETYNFVLREAISSGALVIASDIGAMPEAITEGENGFLFEPCNADSLLVAMRKARDFDFSKYSTVSFPSPDLEACEYRRIYSSL